MLWWMVTRLAVDLISGRNEIMSPMMKQSNVTSPPLSYQHWSWSFICGVCSWQLKMLCWSGSRTGVTNTAYQVESSGRVPRRPAPRA